MITADRIQQLYDKYLELVRLEIVEFGVKPTEVRHLIGRLGEFHCALQVGGTLAYLANQHGFDVVCRNGRRISVKTTAQTTGFVPIGKATIDKVDDLMIIQYRDGELSILYRQCGVQRSLSHLGRPCSLQRSPAPAGQPRLYGGKVGAGDKPLMGTRHHDPLRPRQPHAAGRLVADFAAAALL